jgi:hypothetical protein
LLFTSTNPQSPRSEDLDPFDIMESSLIGADHLIEVYFVGYQNLA